MTQLEFNKIEELCKKYEITDYHINTDGSIDVYYDVYLSNKNLLEIPIKFRIVDSYFYCSNNKLTTLEGVPQSIIGDFICYHNPLNSIRELFPDDKTFYKLCMEWEFFAGGKKIYKHRFLEAMLDINKELPESIPGYEYI